MPAEPVTKPGDLIILGEHRLICASCTGQDDVDRLMAGDRAACMWTDPPYGVSYKGKTKDQLEIRNDGREGLEELLAEAFATATVALGPGAAAYVAHPPGALHMVFDQAWLAAGWRLHQTLVWVKDSMVLGHADYHYRHEPILFGYTLGEGRRGRGGDGWYGDHKQTTVLEHPRPKASREHPTSKPVALVEQCLANSTQPGDLVLDLFAGSGSTLIACENLGRHCRAIELDPRYCDVIIERWRAHTGREPERVT